MAALPPKVSSALTTLGLTFLMIISGYYWGYRIGKAPTAQTYVFKALNANGATISGFACVCSKPAATSVWLGSGINNNCGNVAANNAGRRLAGIKLPNEVNASNIACCKEKPKIMVINAGTKVPKILINKLGANCWT